MTKLSEAQKRAFRRGFLIVPREISWRRADKLVRDGLATIYPFHERWQGRLDLTRAGRSALQPPATGHPIDG